MQIRMRKIPVGIIFKDAIFNNDYSGLSDEYAKMVGDFMKNFPNGTVFAQGHEQFIAVDMITKRNEQCFNLLVGA